MVQSLNSAQIILLLISPDYTASDYCIDVEMRRAMEWHERGEARVIPVILKADQHLLPIVSTISWATLHWSTLRQGKTAEQFIEATLTKAQEYGCSLAVGFAIAEYLQQHMPDS